MIIFMKIITKDELIKIAQLSGLHLDEQEIPGLIKHITDVLAYASRVQEAVCLGRDESRNDFVVNVVRPDIVKCTDSAIIMAQVPQKAQNFIVVPHILEGQ